MQDWAAGRSTGVVKCPVPLPDLVEEALSRATVALALKLVALPANRVERLVQIPVVIPRRPSQFRIVRVYVGRNFRLIGEPFRRRPRSLARRADRPGPREDETPYIDPTRVPMDCIEVPNPGMQGLVRGRLRGHRRAFHYRFAQDPASHPILQYVRHSIKRQLSGAVSYPRAPPAVLEGSRPDVGFLGALIVGKFQYDVPLYRQHQRLRRPALRSLASGTPTWCSTLPRCSRPSSRTSGGDPRLPGAGDERDADQGPTARRAERRAQDRAFLAHRGRYRHRLRRGRSGVYLAVVACGAA